MRDFYNTIAESNHIEYNSIRRCQTQQDKILAYFRMNPSKEFTPFQVQRELSHEFVNTPITSIRRAMTNLTEQGFLQKTNIQRKGAYNKKNYTWRLRTKNSQLSLL